MSDSAVVVAMILVRMMQMALHQVISVIAMRDCLVTASRAVGVLCLVGTASMGWRTCGRIRAALRKRMLMHMAVSAVDTMQVAFVQIVNVVVVLDGRMTASGPVAM